MDSMAHTITKADLVCPKSWLPSARPGAVFYKSAGLREPLRGYYCL